MTHNFRMAPSVSISSVIFTADSIGNVEIKDIPIAVLKLSSVSFV